MYFCGEKKIRSMTSLAEEKMSIIFGPQRIQNARHSQGDDNDDLPRHCLAVGISDSHPTPSFTFHSNSHDIPVFRPPAAPYVCGTSHAIANAVRYHIPDPSCDKDAREHSRHMVMALASDCSLHRVAKHGILIFFLPRYLPSLSLIGVA